MKQDKGVYIITYTGTKEVPLIVDAFLGVDEVLQACVDVQAKGQRIVDRRIEIFTPNMLN